MDPNWQGGDPNGRGAYHNYNTGQRHDHPSSSARRWRPQLQEAMPLQMFTSWPQLQPLGGFIMNQSSSGVVLIPTDGNIPGYDFAPMAVSMPGDSGYHYSESVVPRPPMPNVIGSQDQYQPHSGSAAVFPAPEYNPVYPPGTGVYAQQRGSGTVFNAPGYDSNPHASVYQPGAPLYAQPGDATDFSAWGRNANNDPYTSAGLIPPPANANQCPSRGPVPAVPNRSRPALRNVWANDLRVAVERARTPGDLEAIVNTVISKQNTGVPLMEVAQPRSGERALTKLVGLAALNLGPEVLQRLFRCLVNGWIMEQSNGPSLLQHFFTTLGYVHCSIFIDELAVPRFSEMVTSRIGYMSIMMCLDTEQGTALHDAIVINTIPVARDMFGSTLLQNVFERGRNNQLIERIRERVEENLVGLSMDQYGNRVVQACFVPSKRMPPASVLLLQRGLDAFLRLPGEQLRELVQNHRARYVLCRLLRTSVHRPVPSAEALELAVRILGVGAAGDETDMHMLNSLARRVIDKSKS